MIMATFGDMIIMTTILLLLPVFKVKWHEMIKLEMLAVGIALVVELYATRTQRWFYTNTNILIPWLQISIFPLLQMMIIVPICFKFSDCSVRKI